jgi:hypothetical protein
VTSASNDPIEQIRELIRDGARRQAEREAATAMNKPHQWECQTPSEAKAMTDWVNAELDWIKIHSENFVRYGESTLTLDERYALEQAIEEADRGNVASLQRLYPHLARFLQPPALGVGEKYPKDNSNDPVNKAMVDVETIHLLWRRYFLDHKRRPKGDLVKAEQIAADRHGVDIKAVESKLKNRHRNNPT